MLSIAEKIYMLTTILIIDAIIMGLVVGRLLVKSEARKIKKITPRRTIKQQINDERIKAKYKLGKNFKIPLLFKFFIILFVISYVFTCYILFAISHNIVIPYWINPLIIYPVIPFSLTGLYFSRRKSIEGHYFLQEYLTEHPENEAHVVLLPLSQIKRADKSLKFLGIVNLVTTIILIIVIFIL